MTQYASDMNVLLSYHNLLDDWQDEKKLSEACDVHDAGKAIMDGYRANIRDRQRQWEAYMRKLNMLEQAGNQSGCDRGSHR